MTVLIPHSLMVQLPSVLLLLNSTVSSCFSGKWQCNNCVVLTYVLILRLIAHQTVYFLSKIKHGWGVHLSCHYVWYNNTRTNCLGLSVWLNSLYSHFILCSSKKLDLSKINFKKKALSGQVSIWTHAFAERQMLVRIPPN